MTYTAVYAIADIDDIIIDIIGKFLAAFGDQAAIIAGLIVLGIVVAVALSLFGGVAGIMGMFKKFGK